MSGDHLRPGRKDVKDFVSFAREHGFELVGRTGNGHFRLRHLTGQALSIPATPSSCRWSKNARATVLRIHRTHLETA